jgi:hypothetical protein
VTTVHWLASRFFSKKKCCTCVACYYCAEAGRQACTVCTETHADLFKKEKKKSDTCRRRETDGHQGGEKGGRPAGRQEDASLFCSDEEGARDGLNSFLSSPGDPDRHCDGCKFCSCVSCARRKELPRCIRRFQMKKLLISIGSFLVLEGKLLLIRTENAFGSWGNPIRLRNRTTIETSICCKDLTELRKKNKKNKRLKKD